jgi:hypothetical protein
LPFILLLLKLTTLISGQLLLKTHIFKICNYLLKGHTEERFELVSKAEIRAAHVLTVLHSTHPTHQTRRYNPQAPMRFTCLVLIPLEHEPSKSKCRKKLEKNYEKINTSVTRFSSTANGAKIHFENIIKKFMRYCTV